MSSKEVVINTPAAKAPRIPMFFLCLVAKIPPNIVEKQVITAKRIASKFIGTLGSDSELLNDSGAEAFYSLGSCTAYEMNFEISGKWSLSKFGGKVLSFFLFF
jgi:hypothetical protein